MHSLDPYFEGLSSTDPVVYDEAYDNLLFATENDANIYLIEKIQATKSEPSIHRTLLQLLGLRGSTSAKSRWYTRYQGTLTLGQVANALFDALSDVDAWVRKESIQSLADLCENNLNQSQLTEMLTTFPQVVYSLRYPEFIDAVCTNLDHVATMDVDVDVQMLASETIEQIRKDFQKFKRNSTWLQQVSIPGLSL